MPGSGLEVRDLTVRFDGAAAVDAVDLDVPAAVSYTQLTLPTKA
jgi:ABC-type branched-subunit amino acid transport system ATPase component